MDTAIGSTRVPESSGRLSESVPRDGNGEPSKRCEEQNQSQPHAAPTSSGVRFKIRSARERKQSLESANNFKSEVVEKASRSIKDYREEMPTIHTISPLSPNTDMIDKRKPRVLNQLSLIKTEEPPMGSEKSSTIQTKPDCPESPSTKGRGRTEWRQGLLSNRSKSLDWRGPKNERGQENQMEVFRNTKELEGRAIRRSESLERNSANVNEVARPLKRVSLQIHAFSGSGQKKHDSNAPISPESGTSPRRMVALAQSFPSILKGNQSPVRTEEKKSPWHFGHSTTKSDQVEHHSGSRVTSPKVSEITGNHTVIEKNGLNVLEDNSTKVAQTDQHVRPQVTASKVNEITGNLSRSKSSNSSLDKCSSFSSISKVKTVAYSPEKGGTFPKAPFKKQQMAFTTVPDTFVSERKDNLVTTSTGSKEKPLSQESSSLVTNNSVSDGKRQTGQAIEQGTRSLGRARIRHFTAPISYPSYCSKETEGQIEKITSNSNQTKGNTTSPGKPHSPREGVTPWTKPPSSPSEFGSSGNPSKKTESSVEKVKEPSLDSVRNTIHKFEALAQQNQSSARIQHPRRALSVIEMPKSLVTLNKTYSARSLGVRSGDWSKEYTRENLFTKSEVSNDAVSDLSGPVQITTRDKEVSRVKTQSGTKSQVTGVEQMKLLDKFPSSQKKETKFTVMNKHMDEPDFSKGSNVKSCQKNITNSELTKETVKENQSSATSHNSKKSSGTTNVSHSGVNDFSSKPESKFSKATKDKPFLPSGNTPVLASSDSSTAIKSTGNSARSKSSSSLLNDSALNAPFQVFPSASGDLSLPYNTIKDEKVAEKVIRWIMDKGVDDQNDDDDEDDDGTMTDYDSDSGESTVTITSNMSSRSFSMSLVELCSLGGLDLPPSDGNGSKDDENWMSKRTVSMSSDVSALSSVTLLSMDELDCLLNDVRNLEDDALENYEDVHVVVLHKDAGNGLGFTVAGGVDQNKPVTVHTVLRNGVAAQEGSIHVGDQVLSINGTALRNSTHKEAHNTVRRAKGKTMAVVVIRRGDVTDACCSLKDSPQKATGNPGSRKQVTLNKSSSDLGFSLEGGVGSALGDKPLTVQRLFQGGPVGKVFPGDELLEVGGQTLDGLRRLEVWQLIRRLPPGPVEVLLQRPCK